MQNVGPFKCGIAVAEPSVRRVFREAYSALGAGGRNDTGWHRTGSLRDRRGRIPGGLECPVSGDLVPSGESSRQSDGDSFGVGWRRCPVGFGRWIRLGRTGDGGKEDGGSVRSAVRVTDPSDRRMRRHSGGSVDAGGAGPCDDPVVRPGAVRAIGEGGWRGRTRLERNRKRLPDDFGQPFEVRSLVRAVRRSGRPRPLPRRAAV